MATSTLLATERLLNQAIGDDIRVVATTDIAASKLFVSTNLQEHDLSENGYFDNWWIHIETFSSAGVIRRLGSTTYATSTGTCYVYGADLTADSSGDKATAMISRFDPNNKKLAINRAMREIYPAVYVPIENRELITGQYLPDGHLESWSTSSTLTYWTTSGATLAQTSASGSHRGGVFSATLTSTTDSGYMFVSSNDFPRLLDLQGAACTFRGWANPQIANDPILQIYTLQADGTEQFLTSETTSPASNWTKIELESQNINDDLDEIQFRAKVATDTSDVIWDDLYVNGRSINEILLPDDFQTGDLYQVHVQETGHSSNTLNMYDDLRPDFPFEMAVEVIDDGTYKYVQIPIISGRRVRLLGTKPFTDYSADSDTITIDHAKRLDLIIYYAAALLYEMEAGTVSANDRFRYLEEASAWKRRFREALPSLSMPRFSSLLRY